MTAHLRSPSIQLSLLAVVTVAAAYGRTALGPLQETMRTALALTDNQMALLQGPAMALPVVIAGVPLGLLIDRYSRVRLLIIFAVFSVVGSLLTAYATDFALLLLARCLVGLTYTGALTAVFSLAADLYAPAQRGRATMVLLVSAMAGNSAAFALGGAFLAMSDAGADAWRSAMLMLVAPLIPVLALMFAMREPSRTERTPENRSAREVWPELWRERAVIAPLLAGMILLEMAFMAVYVWAAPTLARTFDLPPERTGAIMAMGLMLSGLLGPIAGGFLADHCQRRGGPRRAIAVLSGIGLSSLPAGCFAFVPHIALASALLVTFMVIVCAALAMGTALFTVVVPGEVRGLGMSIMFAGNTLFGVALAPMMVSALAGVIGGAASVGKALALVGITSMLLAAAVLAAGRRNLSRVA